MSSHYYDAEGNLVEPGTPNAWPSPTTILDIIAKPELDAWRQRYDAENGEGAAEAYMIMAQERGTRIHSLCEEWVCGQKLEVEEFDDIDYFIGFMNWAEKVRPEFVETEIFLESRKYRYRGRCDIVCRIDDKLWIIDIKTGALRWGHAYQLRYYEQAYFEKSGEHARMGVLGLSGKASPKQHYHKVKELDKPLVKCIALKMIHDDYMEGRKFETVQAGAEIWAPEDTDQESIGA